jgi:hypothetical protein
MEEGNATRGTRRNSHTPTLVQHRVQHQSQDT